MVKSFVDIKKGILQWTNDFAKDEQEGKKVFQPSEVDVKKLRRDIGMTQAEFASTFGISVNTLRHWERGDRTPHGPALVLLNLVQKDPQAILKILYQ